MTPQDNVPLTPKARAEEIATTIINEMDNVLTTKEDIVNYLTRAIKDYAKEYLNEQTMGGTFVSSKYTFELAEKARSQGYEQGYLEGGAQDNIVFHKASYEKALEEAAKVAELHVTNHYKGVFREGFEHAKTQISENIRALKEKSDD